MYSYELLLLLTSRVTGLKNIRNFVDMRYSSIIVIFVFLQMLVKTDAAVARYGEELQPQRAPVLSEEEQIVKRLIAMLDDMRADLVNDQQIVADDPNVNNSGYHSGSRVGDYADTSGGYNRDKITQQAWIEAERLRNEARIAAIDASKKFLQIYFEKNGVVIKNIKTEEKVGKIVEELMVKEAELRRSSCCTRAVSLYPLCNHGSTTKEYEHRDTINLYFDVQKFKPSPNVYYTLDLAVLHIYKTAFKASTSFPEISPDKNVTVRVVFFTQPADTKSSPKRKSIKLGKQILRSDAEQWTQWDVKKAVEKWYNDTSTNYGITIKVEEDEAVLPAREFFNTLNCSNITALPPLLPETLRGGSMANISIERPFLDLRFNEMSTTDTSFADKQDAYLNELKVLKQKILGDFSSERMTRSRKK